MSARTPNKLPTYPPLPSASCSARWPATRAKNSDSFANRSSTHRLNPSVKLRKADDGTISPAGYNDLLLLSAGPIREEERLSPAKRMAQILPSTVAAFVGSGGQSLKILVRITLPDAQRQQNETEMDRFFRKAYEVASTLYGSILQLPVGARGIYEGASPRMAAAPRRGHPAPDRRHRV